MHIRLGFVLLFSVPLLLAGCGDSSPADGGGAGGVGGVGDDAGTGGGAGSTEDAADDADPDSAADGPWECLEGNIARWKEDGWTEPCKLMLCKTSVGCGDQHGCSSDADCVTSTKEVGWDVDYPVHCDMHICDAVIQQGADGGL